MSIAHRCDICREVREFHKYRLGPHGTDIPMWDVCSLACLAAFVAKEQKSQRAFERWQRRIEAKEQAHKRAKP